MAMILDGKRIAAEIRAEIKAGVGELRAARGIVPGIAFVTVGADPASITYVRMKENACAEAGIRSRQFSYPEAATESKVIEKISALNSDCGVHGILVQLPLPRQIRMERIIEAISPGKDVDGFHPVNVGKLLQGDESGFKPCTPLGVIELLVRSGGTWEGKDVVIIGRSNIVGKPLAALLMQRGKAANATVTVCHTCTRDLPAHSRRADIVIAAIGKPCFLTAAMVREGAIVIDVGINRVEDPAAPKGYRLVGDVDFERVSRKAAAVSPVPGGVGPMTIAMLLSNTLKAASMQGL